MSARAARLPDPLLAAGWFGFAHLALLAAALLLAAEPELLAATFYHPRLLAAVHLLTLGWISGSILGALYLVLPMAMRVRVPARRGDRLACALFATGTIGMAVSFLAPAPRGIALGGATAAAAAGWVAWRTLPPLRRAPVTPAVRAAFPLAFAGFALAAVVGLLAALGARTPSFFAIPFAHAHLAALGWAFLVVLGAGYRLLPMLLPAAMPPARRGAAAVGTAAGASVALPAGLLLAHRPLTAAGASLAVAGVALLLRDVAWMLRHRKPVPPARPRPDLPLGHAGAAFVALAAAAGCGVAILLLPGPAPGVRAAYGVLGLLGFFGQLVAGVGQRLAGWLAWLHAYARSGFRAVPPTPYALLPRWPQRVALAGWWLAVPAIALGAGLGRAWLVRAGALALAVAVLAGAAALAHAGLAARRAQAGAAT